MVDETYTEQQKINDFIEDYVDLIDQYGFSLEQAKEIITKIEEL